MGLFSSLFSGKKETKSETLKNERGAYELKMWQFFPWDLPEPEKHIELTGKSVSKIYVYNAEPLDVELEEYQFELARGDYEMLSLYTETSWNSSYNGDIAVLFENQPIGFVELPRDLIKQLMEKGYTFSITAYQDGWWSDEVPDLKAKVDRKSVV